MAVLILFNRMRMLLCLRAFCCTRLVTLTRTKTIFSQCFIINEGSLKFAFASRIDLCRLFSHAAACITFLHRPLLTFAHSKTNLCPVLARRVQITCKKCLPFAVIKYSPALGFYPFRRAAELTPVLLTPQLCVPDISSFRHCTVTYRLNNKGSTERLWKDAHNAAR